MSSIYTKRTISTKGRFLLLLFFLSFQFSDPSNAMGNAGDVFYYESANNVVKQASMEDVKLPSPTFNEAAPRTARSAASSTTNSNLILDATNPAGNMGATTAATPICVLAVINGNAVSGPCGSSGH